MIENKIHGPYDHGSHRLLKLVASAQEIRSQKIYSPLLNTFLQETGLNAIDFLIGSTYLV